MTPPSSDLILAPENSEVMQALARTHERIAQLHIQPVNARTLTARNYNSSIMALIAFLREQGCEEVQGFLFGEPVPATAFQPAREDA